MAQTPEGKVKDAIKKMCKRVGAYYFMPVQNGMGAPTLDFLICYKGLFFGVETKAPGKKATPRQELTMSAIRQSSGWCAVIDSVAKAESFNEVMDAVVKLRVG